MPKQPRKRPLAALLTGVYGQQEQTMQQMCGEHLRTMDAPMTHSAKLSIGMHTRTALTRLMRGQAIHEDLAALALAANIAMLLAERGLGEELLPEIIEAQQVTAILMRQMDAYGKPRPTGPMLTSIRKMLEISEAQLDSPDCTQASVEAATLEFNRRVASGAIFEVTKD